MSRLPQLTGDLLAVSIDMRVSRVITYSRRDEVLADHGDELLPSRSLMVYNG
jgi:hypothetical protein